MSLLIVEDGTGVANANAYINTDYADTYLSSLGISAWDNYSVPVKEKAIIEATQTIDLVYNFSGVVTKDDQDLEFPRTDCYDKKRNIFLPPSIIPVNLKNATAELAYTRISSNEALIESSGSEILKREKVGSLEVERFNQSSFQLTAKFKKVTNFLERYTEMARQKELSRG